MSGECEVQKVNGTLHCVWLAGMRGQSPPCRRFYCTNEKRERGKVLNNVKWHSDTLTQKWAEIVLGSSLKSSGVIWSLRHLYSPIVSVRSSKPISFLLIQSPKLANYILLTETSFQLRATSKREIFFFFFLFFSPLSSEGLFTVDQRTNKEF